jgi:hypothetical protein
VLKLIQEDLGFQSFENFGILPHDPHDRQLNNKLNSLAFLCFHFYLTTTRFDDIISSPQTRSVPCPFGFAVKNKLRYFINGSICDTIPIIANGYGYLILRFFVLAWTAPPSIKTKRTDIGG